jgi:hypothetical protein
MRLALAIAMLGSLACASRAPVADPHPDDLSGMMMHFYEQPDPQRIEPLLQGLSEQRVLDNPIAIPPVQGFIASAAQRYPDQVAGWARVISTLPASDQAQLWPAIWLAGTDESRAALASARDAGLEAASRQEFENPPPALRTLVVGTPSHMDFLWGAFFASGDTAYLDPILGVLDWDLAEIEKTFYADEARGRYLLAVWTTAQWGLRSNAKHHAAVLTFCQERLETAQEPRASLLRQIVAGARSAD